MTRCMPRAPQFAVTVRRGASGFGLFAQEDIPRGRFVVEYHGSIVTDDEADAIGGRYLFELGDGKTIDGSARTNIARYANHGCLPNCETRQVGNRVYIFTRRKVRAGEELLHDYGKEYFRHYIKPHGCRCGAKKHLK